MNVSYYPGCSLDGTARDYGESLESVCKTLEIGLKELHDWNCCGASSAHCTSDVLALALAARNLEIADKAGMDLVVPCAACYQRLKVAEKEMLAGKPVEGISRKYEGNFRIRNIVDFFWQDVGEKALTRQVKRPLQGLKLVCYYGCLTARPPKVTDARDAEDPRSMDRLLGSLGANVRSWSYKTECCGGSLVLTRPDIAMKLIQKLLDMAQEAGAECIAVSCPMCQSNLDIRQKKISQETGKKYNIPILYFSELMGLSFGDTSTGKWLRRHMTNPRPLLKQKGLI